MIMVSRKVSGTRILASSRYIGAAGSAGSMRLTPGPSRRWSTEMSAVRDRSVMISPSIAAAAVLPNLLVFQRIDVSPLPNGWQRAHWSYEYHILSIWIQLGYNRALRAGWLVMGTNPGGR